jgi:hypothetical protein
MLALAVGAALGANAQRQGRDHSGILLPKSAFDHGARKLAGKTGHRAQHPPKAKGAKGKHAKNLVNGENEHGPKWQAKYGDSADQREGKQASAKRLSQKQVPTADEMMPDPDLVSSDAPTAAEMMPDPELVSGADDPTIASVPEPERVSGADDPTIAAVPEPERVSGADDPTIAAADTGGEAAAAARAAASGANAPTAKVDDTDYEEADASGNTDMPLPAPAVCTGPGALAGDPACAVAQPVAADPSDPAAAPEPCVSIMASVSDEWCDSNCAINNCPANMCDCSGGVEEEVDPDRPVCESIAPNVSDDWCQTNCEAWVRHEEGFFNCPPSQCKCTEHNSADTLGAAAGMGYMKATPP